MAASTPLPRGSAAHARPIPLRRRLYGLGSVYGKTIRDSRLAFIIAAGLLGGMALLMGAAVPQVFPTPEARHEVDALIGAIPSSMVNLFGRPVELGTLGGYMTWKYGAMFAMGTVLWSIMALSSTLASEARRGSLDMVATTPLGKRRIALEKLAAHLTPLAITMLILGVAATAGSMVFGDPALGDRIPLIGGIGFGAWILALALAFGGLAFMLSPVLGRAGAAGVAGIAMLVLWLANGVESLDPVAFLSPFRWTADHIALVGQFDWLPVLATGLLGVGLMVAGVALFERRDLGVTLGLSLPRLPALVLGTRNPYLRAFGDMLPRALAWGIGLFLMGAMLSAMVGPLVAQIKGDAAILQTFQQIFPAFALDSTGGWLQLFAELMFIAFGFAGATFVARWASDETDDRLEVLLATPMSRTTWVVAGGVAALFATVVITVLFAIGIGSGTAGTDIDATESMLGTASLGLFTAAIVGIGVAIGGWFRTSIAAEIAALAVVATYLLDLLVLPLGLPTVVRELALTSQLGQPMTGQWDPVGIVACLVLAVGGIGLGAWGMTRRDVQR